MDATVKWIFGIFFLACAHISLSQKPSEEFQFRSLSVEDGLSHGSVTCFLEDRHGFLWIGTYDGLNRFDGNVFRTFYHDPHEPKASLSNNSISALHEDSQGKIWIGTIDGLTTFDPEEGHFEVYALEGEVEIVGMTEDAENNLWVATRSSGLILIKPNGSFQMVDVAMSLWYIHFIPQHPEFLWIASTEGLLKYHIENGSIQQYKNDPKDLNSLASNSLNGLTSDSLGHLWISCTSVGIDRFDPVSEEFEHFTNDTDDPTSLGGYEVARLLFDSEGSLWISMYGSGLRRMKDVRTGKFERFTSNSSGQFTLKSDNIVPLYKDKANRIWIGTRGEGVHFLDPREVKFGVWKVNKNIASVFEEDAENLWIGYREGGIDYLQIDSATNQIKASGPLSMSPFTGDAYADYSIIHISELKNGSLAFGAISNGLFIYDPLMETTRRYLFHKGDLKYVLNASVYDVHESAGGQTYLLTKVGLFRYDADQKEFRNNIDHQVLNDAIFNDIKEDKKGCLWLGSEDYGLVKYDPINNTLNTFIGSEEDDHSASFPRILSMEMVDDRKIYLGTWGEGLYVYDIETDQMAQYTDADGLPNNVIYSIEVARNGDLWLSTNRGLSRFDVQKKQFANYDRKDGLQGEEFNSRVSYSGNRMYFGGVNGLNVFSPKDFDTAPESGKLILSGYSFENSEGLHSSLKAPPKELVLKHNDYALELSFSHINPSIKSASALQYRLEPVNRNWLNSEGGWKVNYASLSPGKYELKARAMNAAYEYSNEVIQKITIVPAWWKRWWMLLVYFIIFVGIFYFIYYNRVKQLVRYQDLRTKISADLHDEVGSILSGLAMQSELVSYSVKDEQKDLLSEISTMSRSAMESMRDIVWAIDARKDKYENLVDRMRSFAEKTLAKKDIAHHFDVHGLDLTHRIDPVSRQQIYLIFKEAITNIIKHSDGDKVEVFFGKEKGQILLRVEDNGTALNTRKTDGSGLANIKMRAERQGGNVKFKKSDGFVVELRMPF